MFETQHICCADAILELIQFRNYNSDYCDEDAVEEYTFTVFVHETILSKFKQMILTNPACSINDDNIWDYTLRIGDKPYSMKLVSIDLTDPDDGDELVDLIYKSKISFPWDNEVAAIQTTEETSYLIGGFIESYNLTKNVRRVYSDSSYTYASQIITVAEFNDANADDIHMSFAEFIESNDNRFPVNYYVTAPFDYLTTRFLKYLDKPFNNPDVITQVLLLLDYHRQQMRKNVEIFNILDLISMKMAIDDNRFEYENCEFHKLLDRTFCDMIERKDYIQSNCFNLVKYLANRSIIFTRNIFKQYLISHFSRHFKTIIVSLMPNEMEVRLSEINPSKLCDNIAQFDALEFRLYVDCSDYDENNSNVLQTLLTNSKCQHIIIIFSTWHPWRYVSNEYSQRSDNVVPLTVQFDGANTHFFIENFFNWMQLVLKSESKVMNFVISGPKHLHSYILRDFFMKHLTIYDMVLDYKFINGLARAKYETITIRRCRIKNDPNIFVALERLHNVEIADIIIQDETINMLFKMIETELASTVTERFEFKNNIRLYNETTPIICIDLLGFKYYLNNDRTQIVTYDWARETEVNIYDHLSYSTVFEKREDFNFYT